MNAIMEKSGRYYLNQVIGVITNGTSTIHVDLIGNITSVTCLPQMHSLNLINPKLRDTLQNHCLII